MTMVGTGATAILSAGYTIARYRPTRSEATLAALEATAEAARALQWQGKINNQRLCFCIT